MKRLGSAYDKLCNFESLYKAFLITRKGKRNNLTTIEFEMNLGSNLQQLKFELENKTYRPRPYRIFEIYEPKERIIRAPHFRDRIVHHCLCDNILEPLFERHFITHTFACRKNKGTHIALVCLEK